MDIEKAIAALQPYPTNVFEYRLIPNFGWYVVGYTKAKDLGLKHYSTPSSMCAKGHVAPMLVQKAKCIKCIAVEARNKGVVMTNSEAFEYWRKRLRLPVIDQPEGKRCVYVVEHMPYTLMADAVAMTGLTDGMIQHRCRSEAFPDYQRIPTKFALRQSHIYRCGRNDYETLKQAAEAEGLHFYEVASRITSKTWPNWTKIKVM